MAEIEYFESQLSRSVADWEKKVTREFVAFAKGKKDQLVASGKASPVYTRYVNNVPGRAEEQVVLPGPILYVFVSWSPIIRNAIAELKRRVPQKSGRYANSFIVLANNALVTDYSTIPAKAEVLIINSQPYTRKMESGGNTTGKRHFEKAKNALAREYGRNGIDFDLAFLTVPSGVAPGVPYVLKTSHEPEAAVQNRRSSAYRAGRILLSRRKDRQAGMSITYPALIINIGVMYGQP
ncbi:hypothetical protein FB480_101847 [Agrobacterium vitis]|nr:hypothetical protein FB480_101847 [Agrobacterium vitis]